MDKQKLKWVVPGAVLGLGVLWWGMSAYASSKAEDRLRETLARYGLQDSVHWSKLSASVFGSVKLKDVTLDSRMYGRLKADIVHVDDVIDKPDRQRVTLDVRGLTDLQPEKASFFLGKLAGAPTGKPQLPPMDARLRLDLKYADDRGTLGLDLRQKDAVDISHEMEVSRIGALRELASAGTMMESRQGGGFGMGGFGVLGALSSLSAISLASLEVKVEDRGMVERGIALYKRHNIPVTHDGGSLKSQRDKGFETAMANWQGQCERDRQMQLTKDAAKTCKALGRFLGGDKRTIELKVKPETPVSSEQLVSLFFGRANASAAALLNAEVF